MHHAEHEHDRSEHDANPPYRDVFGALARISDMGSTHGSIQCPTPATGPGAARSDARGIRTGGGGQPHICVQGAARTWRPQPHCDAHLGRPGATATPFPTPQRITLHKARTRRRCRSRSCCGNRREYFVVVRRVVAAHHLDAAPAAGGHQMDGLHAGVDQPGGPGVA